MVSRMRHHKHGYGERAAATLIEKALSAVVYCHHHGVVHRDIKLDNFIYENEGEDAELLGGHVRGELVWWPCGIRGLIEERFFLISS